jgi:hypothetical protein
MPVIERIEIDQLSPRSREIIKSGVADGLYATTVPLQIFAYCSGLLESMHAKWVGRGEGSLLGGRILAFIRIRSEQLGECQPCMQSRKHDAITAST